MTKVCVICKIEKSISNFHKSKKCKSGISGVCTPCKKRNVDQNLVNEKTRLRYKTDINFNTRKKARSAKYRLENREKILLEQAKVRSKRINMECTLSLKDIVIPDLCPLLKVPLLKVPSDKRSWNAPSLDRFDVTKGYTPENTIVISLQANTMKNKATLQELKLFCTNMLAIIDNKI